MKFINQIRYPNNQYTKRYILTIIMLMIIVSSILITDIRYGNIHLLIFGPPSQSELIEIRGITIIKKYIKKGGGHPNKYLMIDDERIKRNLCNKDWNTEKNIGLDAIFKIDKFGNVWEANISGLGYCNILHQINSKFSLKKDNQLTLYVLTAVISIEIILMLIMIYILIQDKKVKQIK